MSRTRLVGELIKTQTLRSVHPNYTLEMCANVLISNNICRVPVISNEGRLLGLLSERDLRLAADVPQINTSQLDSEVSARMKKITAEEVMSKNPVTITTGTPVANAVKLMSVRNIKGLPVVDPNTEKVVGMCTQTDMVNCLLQVLEEKE